MNRSAEVRAEMISYRSEPAILHHVVGEDKAAAMDEGNDGREGFDRHAHKRGEIFHEVVESEDVEAPLVGTRWRSYKRGPSLTVYFEHVRVEPEMSHFTDSLTFSQNGDTLPQTVSL